jgi:hypothetical protein
MAKTLAPPENGILYILVKGRLELMYSIFCNIIELLMRDLSISS